MADLAWHDLRVSWVTELDCVLVFLALPHPATPALGTGRGSLEMQDGSATEGSAGWNPDSTHTVLSLHPVVRDLVGGLKGTVQPWTGKDRTPRTPQSF